METESDTAQVGERARTLLDGMIGSVESLSDAIQRSQEAQQRAAEELRSARASWKATLKAGWTVKQLGELGLREPSAKTVHTTPRKHVQRTAGSDHADAGVGSLAP